MFSFTCPGGIIGAIQQSIIDSGEGTPEMKAQMDELNKEWEDAGLRRGQWATRTESGKLVAVGSPEHEAEVRAFLGNFKTTDGRPVESEELVKKLTR